MSGTTTPIIGQNASRSGETTVHIIYPPALLIDAHMHIMSLNCTPMPLQWATAYLKGLSFIPTIISKKDQLIDNLEITSNQLIDILESISNQLIENFESETDQSLNNLKTLSNGVTETLTYLNSTLGDILERLIILKRDSTNDSLTELYRFNEILIDSEYSFINTLIRLITYFSNFSNTPLGDSLLTFLNALKTILLESNQNLFDSRSLLNALKSNLAIESINILESFTATLINVSNTLLHALINIIHIPRLTLTIVVKTVKEEAIDLLKKATENFIGRADMLLSYIITELPAALNLVVSWAAPNLTRKDLNQLLGVIDFAKIGRFSTNLIADIYMGKARNADMEAHLYWLKAWSFKIKTSANRAEAGEKLKLQELTTERFEIGSFKDLRAEQYKTAILARMNITMPMDLSYAHYWGLHDMPIYLPVLEGNTFFMINDFCYIKKEWKFHSTNYIRIPGVPLPIPIITPTIPLNLNRIKQTQEPLIDDEDDITRLYYLTSLETIGEKLDFSGPLEDTYKDLYQNRYKHYLQEVPGDDTEMFEDYWQQVALHEGAAWRYPFQIIPFFHYDPRRYYADGATKNAILDALTQKHIFFDTQSPDIFNASVAIHDFSPKGKRMPKKYGALIVDKTIKAYFSNVLFDGIFNKTTYEVYKNKNNKDVFVEELLTLPASKKTHAACEIEYLYPNGPFLGVKLYPPLGYPADLASKAQQERFDYPENRFDNYEDLFLHCIDGDNNIPITAHASPLGMSIADAHNYVLRDRYLKKEKPEVKLPSSSTAVLGMNDGEITRADATLYVDEIMTHPMHWERLLKSKSKKEEKEFKTLTLCIAHFSGMDAWTTNVGHIRKDWREDVVKLINEFPNVYTDIACYTLKEEDISKIAPQLAKKLDVNEKLRWRILMGSDWYMAEMKTKGVEQYYVNMHNLLKTVQGLLKGETWDVWHQFSVINPLLFLGLLEPSNRKSMELNTKDIESLKPVEGEDKYGKVCYIADFTRLKNIYTNVNKKATVENLTKDGWRKRAGIPKDFDKKKEDDLLTLRTSNLENLSPYIYPSDCDKDGNLLSFKKEEV